MAKLKLHKKTLKRMAKLGMDTTKIVMQAAPRPDKITRQFLKMFGIKWW